MSVADMAGVVFSAGTVFDGLSVSRQDTESFLHSGSIEGVTSRFDLALLQDLRDVAAFVIDHQGQRSIDADYLCEVNAQITRTGAINPGKRRSSGQQIGVNTRYGRHEPKALSQPDLQSLVESSTSGPDPQEKALELFVNTAKTQPFQDGNKRTAIFAANGLLLNKNAGRLLTIPVDENDLSLADAFNDALAIAYIQGDHQPVKDLLREQGFAPQC
ncbi:Fic family protein [Nesterenkonia jeotgali]|uniref:Prophage maintenance system killer protein n=1 Tax=Nesterenkonia jeotgali TaxID=317018 RepID=A0A839FX63_9MICC|nr:Fic family protein [Nesterenkonia jeotgali]MBA8921347.1 prophage maintenance system killer protein [Nesterenkonia jeotgali]